MKDIIKAAGYTARASVNHIDAAPGQFHLHIESKYADSKAPDEWRTIAKVTCEEWGLNALAEEIFNAIKDRK